MIVYMITFAVSIALAWIGMHTRTVFWKGHIWTIIISSIPLFFLAAFRYGIGTDYDTYTDIYLRNTTNGIRGVYEPAFYFLGRALTLIGAHYQWLFIICAFIYIVFIYISVFRTSPYPLLSIFLLFGMTYYFSFYNTMRQQMGCAILLFSLKFAEQKNTKAFLLCLLIATGIHYSCMCFIIVYAFTKIEITPKRAVVCTSAFWICKDFFIKLLYVALEETRYAKYIEDIVMEFSIASLFGAAVQVAILMLASYGYERTLKYNLYFGSQVIATCITFLGNTVPLIGRVKWIFGISALVLIPMAIKNIKSDRIRRFVMLVVIVTFTVYAYIVIGVLGGHEVIPYKSILTQ